MDIYSKPGTKVKATKLNNGYNQDKELAKQYLTEGAIYTVKEIEVGNWRTEVSLEEINGVWFNSVHFENV